MNAPEEARTPEEVAELDRLGRERLIHGTALAALGASGCRYPKLYIDDLTSCLTVVHPGMRDPLLVLAVDSNGDVRQGPKGPMTAEDLLAELRLDPDRNDLGWGHR